MKPESSESIATHSALSPISDSSVFVMARRYAAIRGVPGKVVDARRWRLRANLLLWSYKHSFWYAECFDLVRKLLLASVVLEVA